MSEPKRTSPLSASFLLMLVRVGIGWHLAYAGWVKWNDPLWTAAPYLNGAVGPLAPFYHWLASDPRILQVVDLLNVWGLLLLGAALVLGALTRLSAGLGSLLLFLYYFAYPPGIGRTIPGSQGEMLFVTPTLIEAVMLLVIAAVPPNRWGLDGIVEYWSEARRRRRAVPSDADAVAPPDAPPGKLARRRLLASLTGVPFFGGLVWACLEQKGYRSYEQDDLLARLDATASPSIKVFSFETLDKLKKPVPKAKINDLTLSRVILGGNLMNGFAHARDLIYVSKLIRAYHTPDRIFATFRLAEECGIDTILTNPMLAPIINEYWDRGIGKIQFIAQCKGKDHKGLLENIAYSLDHGACAAYVQGAAADEYVKAGHIDWIAEALEKFREAGIPAGIGGHHIETIRACVEAGLTPDFWMKTFHHHEYWSADLEDQHDNVWCFDPDETKAYMAQLPQPWIAFKVLAAGAIKPKEAFRYAFENGADIVCAGMYDFQVVENANIVTAILDGKLDRVRPWRA